jgi:hypothetical protein
MTSHRALREEECGWPPSITYSSAVLRPPCTSLAQEQSSGGFSWGAVIAGILIAVIGAAILGGGTRVFDWVEDRFKPDPPNGAYGTWAFDHYVGDPPSSNGMTFDVETLVLRENGTYSVTQHIGAAGGPSMPITQTGDYEMEDDDTISFNPDAGTSDQELTMDMRVSGDALTLIDPSQGITYVFQRQR